MESPIKPLETERLTLRGVQPLDQIGFMRVMMGPEMGLHTDVPAQPSDPQAERFISWMMGLNETDQGRAWSLLLDDETVGFMRFNRIDRETGTASIGYEIAQQHWGKGLASEALGAVVEYGHGQLALPRLTAWILAGNHASARVLGKAGFHPDRTDKAAKLLDGVRRDVMHFARDRDG